MQTEALPAVIALEHASNLRDLGGWPTQDGRRVRTGLVFRAPALVNLSPADEATIARLGLRTICDFRGVRERAQALVEVPGARSLSLPIEPSVGAGLRDILRTGEASGALSPGELLALLRDAYCAYALQCHAQYRALFAAILAPDGLPLLMHCSAGKDRTGFGSALLLTALGVAWENVLQDYLATNDQWRRETANTLFNLPPELKDVLLAAHAPMLAGAFEAIDREYGSTDEYFTKALGLTSELRGVLADLLLV